MNFLRNKRDYICHVLAWLAGVLLLLTPYIYVWEIAPELPIRLGNAQFGINLSILAVLFFTGGVLGGYWWRFCLWLRGENSFSLTSIVTVLFLFSLLSSLGFVDRNTCLIIAVSIFVIGIICAFLNKQDREMDIGGMLGKREVISWFKEPIRSNYLFFIFLFIIIVINNSLALVRIELSTMELISAMAGRVLFSAVIAGCAYILCELGVRATPAKFRWLLWSVISLLPVIIIFDSLLNQLYGRSMLELCNSLTATGEINVMKEIEGGGFQGITEMTVIVVLILVFIIAVSVAAILWLFSTKMKRKTSLYSVTILSLSCYILCIGEQWVGQYWKDLSSWKKEYKAFMLHQGVVSPQLGLADFVVEFREINPCSGALSSDEISKIQKDGLPDVYFIMVESMRYDSIDVRTTPFLMEFQKECQQLESTWAGSNSTHLSWYSLFYSKPSIYWMDDLNSIPDKNDFEGSPVLQMLKSLGYNFEVRVVCDLGYKDFGLQNFGTDDHLVSVMEQSDGQGELSNYNIPTREKMIFEHLLKSVAAKPESGGNFYYMALDSPHYNYYWDKDFDVPYKEYKDDISFPLFPSDEEVELYHNRYLNSVAWVDHQLGEFCEKLKSDGRYDNSIIIVTADHGEEFQELGGWCHCTSIMPEQTQVPILIKWPKSDAPKPVQKEASHADILPTLFSYLRVPEKYRSTMSGVDLLEENMDHTLFVSTAYANKTGETMMLKRNGYTAYFSWVRPWEPRVPDRMRLERITDPNGELISSKKTDDFEQKLRELFPDAFETYIKSLKLVND